MDADPYSAFYRDAASSAKDLTGIINAGVYAINFNGHGGGNVWSDSKFFSYTDLGNLYNGQWEKAGRLPIVFSFTCLTGFFESVFYRSLGEEFVRLPKHGAVAFWGASAYTSKRGNFIMNRILLDYAMNSKVESIGELIWLTKMNMLVRFGSEYISLVNQYNLLGDPALPWKIAENKISISVKKSNLLPKDTLKIFGICPNLGSGNVKVSIGEDYIKWQDFLWKVSSDTFSGYFILKDSLKTSKGYVHAFAWNDSVEQMGNTSFSKDAILFKSVETSKSPIYYGDSIKIITQILPIDSFRKVEALYCLYSIAPRHVIDEPNFFGIPMIYKGNNIWESSSNISIAFNGIVGEELLLKFRATGNGVSDTTNIYSFKILGRPDLAFSKNGTRLCWNNDSLTIFTEVINIGSVNSPPFEVSFYYDSIQNNLPFKKIFSRDSLVCGKTKSFFVTIPDTQGKISISIAINNDINYSEISKDNNVTVLNFNIAYNDLQTPSDTVFSFKKGLRIVPKNNLDKKYRIFIFYDSIGASTPLKTESQWLKTLDDTLIKYWICCRPFLLNSDTLSWLFFMDLANANAKKSASYFNRKPCIMIFDSLINSWRYSTSDFDSLANVCYMHTVKRGPFNIAYLNDTRQPVIRTSVNGKEITFLDYAAKGKPFNIFISDASGINPNSIQILLNQKPLDSSFVSKIYSSSNLSEINATAFPKKEYKIDSLNIIAEDLAGNMSKSSFAYMAGEDLSIKHFSCHPNPFTAKQDEKGNTIQTIRFAFLITDFATNASIKIYTISSKMIWKWEKNEGVIGYNEVAWDGKTLNGDRIANGTYYAKLTVTNDQRKVSSIIRIAKLEGY
jgi:hypothetical protein